MELYDRIGQGYATRRKADWRWAAQIRAVLGEDVRSVVNVGAGAGSYEPEDLEVIAVEPSRVMREQRPKDRPALDGHAEALPLGDKSVDAALAVITDHHWADQAQGYAELARVARTRVVVVTWDQRFKGTFWLTTEYLTEFQAVAPRMLLDEKARLLGRLGAKDVRTEALPIPADCEDAFFMAHWARPEAYLDPAVRGVTSVFDRLTPERTEQAMQALAQDLALGDWDKRHGALRLLPQIDLGMRLLVAEL